MPVVTRALGAAWRHLERWLTLLLDGLTWLLLRLAAIEVSLHEIQARSYAAAPLSSQAPEAEQAEFLFTLQRENSTHTDNKVGQLLALSAALATVVVVFARDAQPRWLLLVLLGALVMSVLLCVTALEVRRETLPTLEAKGSVAKRAWGRDLLASCQANDAAHRLRVDRYRAAVRYFVVALLSTPVLAALSPRAPDRVADIAARLGRLETAGLLIRLVPGDSTFPSRHPAALLGPPSWPWSGAPAHTPSITPSPEERITRQVNSARETARPQAPAKR